MEDMLGGDSIPHRPRVGGLHIPSYGELKTFRNLELDLSARLVKSRF